MKRREWTAMVNRARALAMTDGHLDPEKAGQAITTAIHEARVRYTNPVQVTELVRSLDRALALPLDQSSLDDAGFGFAPDPDHVGMMRTSVAAIKERLAVAKPRRLFPKEVRTAIFEGPAKRSPGYRPHPLYDPLDNPLGIVDRMQAKGWRAEIIGVRLIPKAKATPAEKPPAAHSDDQKPQPVRLDPHGPSAQAVLKRHFDARRVRL